MAVQLGEVLVANGVLTSEQVDEALRVQKQTRRPFGAIAEELFNLPTHVVEDAWAKQYAQIAEHIDPASEVVDGVIAGMIDRRQAWQFRMLPMRLDGEEIRVVTTRKHLLRAMRFTLRHFGQACYFVLSKPEQLAEALAQHFPLPGVGVEAILSTEPIHQSPSDRER